MNSFPTSAFQPQPGKLGHLVFENPDRGVAPRLELSIDLPFGPFEIDDEEISTALLLSGIRVQGRSWRDFENAAADISLADGQVRLFGSHNPVELTSLTFGELSGQTISAKLEFEIDFEMEGNDEYGIIPLTLDAKLEIGRLRIATSINKRLNAEASEIERELAEIVDFAAYGAMEKAPGGLEYPLA
ncbi:MAG: hypothetical protein ACI8UO_003030 [Verrucomicrobiales bacterium]|jgi:hypothetical protein